MKEQAKKINDELRKKNDEKIKYQDFSKIKGDIDDFIFYDNEKLVSER